MTIKTQLGSNRNKVVLLALICVFTIVSPFIFDGGGIFVTDEGTYA